MAASTWVPSRWTSHAIGTPSSLQRFEMKAKTQELTINRRRAFNAGILKPALSGSVLVSGTWELDPVAVQKYNAGTADPGMPRPARGGLGAPREWMWRGRQDIA